MVRNNLVLYIFFIVVVSLVGCGADYDFSFDKESEISRIKKKQEEREKKTRSMEKKQEQNLEDIIKRSANYVYSPVGKRDPFRSYFGDFKVVERERKIVSELQRFDIADLKLTAIIWGITEPRAVIVAPNNKSHIVKRGAFIGKNWGKISKILQDKIEIVETYKDPLGRKMFSKLYLELPVKSLMKRDEEPLSGDDK